MTTVSTSALLAVGATSVNAARVLDPLNAALVMFDVTSKEAVAALIGQCAVETTRFSRFEESLYYTTLEVLTRTFKRVRDLPGPERAKYLRNPQGLANLVYSDRYGNGDVASGDGWKYRGRGGIQTTFQANYAAAEKLTGRPYLDQPDLLGQPSDAMLSAVAYFVDKDCPEMVSSGLTRANLLSVTRAVNPALLEHDLRASLTLAAYSKL